MFSTCMSFGHFHNCCCFWPHLPLYSLVFPSFQEIKLFTEKVKDKLNLTLQSHILKSRVRLAHVLIIVELYSWAIYVIWANKTSAIYPNQEVGSTY